MQENTNLTFTEEINQEYGWPLVIRENGQEMHLRGMIVYSGKGAEPIYRAIVKVRDIALEPAV